MGAPAVSGLDGLASNLHHFKRFRANRFVFKRPSDGPGAKSSTIAARRRVLLERSILLPKRHRSGSVLLPARFAVRFTQLLRPTAIFQTNPEQIVNSAREITRPQL
jgi:hypothetical protein